MIKSSRSLISCVRNLNLHHHHHFRVNKGLINSCFKINSNSDFPNESFRFFSSSSINKNRNDDFLSILKIRGQEKPNNCDPLRKFPTLYLVVALLVAGYSYSIISSLLSSDMVLDKMIQEENGEINLQKASIMPLSLYALLKIKEKYMSNIEKDLESNDENKRRNAIQMIYQMCLDRSLAKSIILETKCLEHLVNLIKQPNVSRDENDLIIGVLKMMSSIENTHEFLLNNLNKWVRPYRQRKEIQSIEKLDNNYITIVYNILSNQKSRGLLTDEKIEELIQLTFEISKISTDKRVIHLANYSTEILVRKSKGEPEDAQADLLLKEYTEKYEIFKFISNNISLPLLAFGYAFLRYKWRINRQGYNHFGFKAQNLNTLSIYNSLKSAVVVSAMAWSVTSLDFYEYREGLKDHSSCSTNEELFNRLKTRAYRQEVEKVAQNFMFPLFLAWVLGRVEFIILPYILLQASSSSKPSSLFESLIDLPPHYVESQLNYIQTSIETEKK